MKTEYYRITAYHAPEGLSIIADSYGKFEKLWEFSAYLVERGFRIIAVDREQFFIDGTMPKVDAPETAAGASAASGSEGTVTTVVQERSMTSLR